MSAGNYMLVRRRRWEPRLLSIYHFLTKGRMLPFGDPQDVMKRITSLFPEVKWEESTYTLPPSPLLPKGIQGPTWFGYAGIEFQIPTNEAGQVEVLHLSRADRAELRRLKRAFQVFALNLDTDSVLGMFLWG